MEKSISKTKGIKIAFTGPESSGKTSLSLAVSKAFNALWFPEYAREYLYGKGGKYTFEDIEKIAIKQVQQRNVNSDGKLIMYDTEAVVLYVWSMFKYNKCSEFILDLLENQQYDHYFLCSPEGILWEDDPLREHPFQREELFQIYLELMEKSGYSFTVLQGSEEERMKKCETVINTMVNPI